MLWKARPPGPGQEAGSADFRELLEHLHSRWKQDRLPGRRLILVLDALNEAPFAEKVIQEALDMVGVVACYPWCKVVVSTRQEWLSLWSGKLGAQEQSPLEELRPFLYVAEVGQRTETGAPRSAADPGPPVVALEPWSEAQAQAVYERYQAATQVTPDQGLTYRIPTCQTPWSALPAATQDLLINPLYLHLFMVTFDGQPVEPVATASALFRRYVDTTLRERPGLRECVDAVMAHLLRDLTRPGADLSDDDCHTIRQAWAAARSAEEARLTLNPVEGLAHEGLLTKRVREEGGGYRFVFQAVAEYLIYRSLAEGRPIAEAEEVYWARRAAPARVFPEYAGAYAFLLRDWTTGERLPQVGPLVEAAPGWLGEVLTIFLIEQARIGYVPGTGSLAAERIAKALAETGGIRSARALHEAGCQQMFKRLALAARAYFQACVTLREALHAAHRDHIQIAYDLGLTLNNLGLLLRATGRVTDAEAALRRAVELGEAPYATHMEIANYLGIALTNLGVLLSDVGRVTDAEAALRRAVELGEAMYATNPDHMEIANGLGMTLNNLGLLLRATGRVTDAEAALRRAVELNEALHAAHPDHMEIANGLGMTLTELGVLLSDAGRVADAEGALRRAVELNEALHAAHPDHMEIANGLGMALTDLGVLLSDAGRVADAEDVSRRAVELNEALHAAHPDHIQIAYDLGTALTHLGLLLRAAGRVTDAEAAYRRAIELKEAVHAAYPDHMAFADGLGGALSNLGALLSDAGRVADAEAAFRRAVELSEALYAANPEHIEIANNLPTALTNLGVLLCDAGRVTDAEAAYRRAVELGEALYAAHPDRIEIANGLGRALRNLGALLCDAGRVTDAEAAYRRAVELGEALYAAHPDRIEIANGLGRALRNLGALLCDAGRVTDAEAAYRRAIDLRVGYAGSLCALGQFAEAGRLVDEVLALVPEHPYANQLRRYVAQQQSLPPDTTKVTLASTAHPHANTAEAARLNMQYQQDLARWQALSWSQRLWVRKPTPPTSI